MTTNNTERTLAAFIRWINLESFIKIEWTIIEYYSERLKTNLYVLECNDNSKYINQGGSPFVLLWDIFTKLADSNSSYQNYWFSDSFKRSFIVYLEDNIYPIAQASDITWDSLRYSLNKDAYEEPEECSCDEEEEDCRCNDDPDIKDNINYIDYVEHIRYSNDIIYNDGSSLVDKIVQHKVVDKKITIFIKPNRTDAY